MIVQNLTQNKKNKKKRNTQILSNKLTVLMNSDNSTNEEKVKGQHKQTE